MISSSGVAACRHGFGPDVGFGYGWGTGEPHIFASSCNVGDWVVGGSTRQVGAPTFGSFAIAGGQPAAVFSVVGTLAPPRAILTGPDGATVAATPDDPFGGIDDGKVLLFQNPEDRTTYIAVKDPAGGLYRLSLKAGLRPRERLPLGAVARRTAGAGTGRRPRPSPGAALDLHRRAAGARWCSTSRAATPAGGSRRRRTVRGRLAFTVPDGRAGTPRDRRHRPPGRADAERRRRRALHGTAAAPAGASGARCGSRQRGGVLSVRWGRATGAASYEVRVVLSDGRRLLFLPERTTRRVTVRGVAAGTRASVTVRGVSATGRRGPRAHARAVLRRRR